MYFNKNAASHLHFHGSTKRDVPQGRIGKRQETEISQGRLRVASDVEVLHGHLGRT